MNSLNDWNKMFTEDYNAYEMFMLVGKYQFFPLVFPQQADFPSHLCHFLYNSFFKRKITNSSFKYILSSSGKKCY